MPIDPFFTSGYKKTVHHEHDAAWEAFKKLSFYEQNDRISEILKKIRKHEASAEECSIKTRFFVNWNARKRVRVYQRQRFYKGGKFAELEKHFNPSGGGYNTCPRQTTKRHK